MAVQSQFISVASHSTDSVSGWIYLVDWILVLILGVAFVFYFDRLIGFVISLLARIIIWRTSNIMISIESVRASVLGGRLMMKNVTITTENQTVSILRVNLTWRYWLWGLTRLPEYYIDSNDSKDFETTGISKTDNERLPARVFVALEGLEIFMYNRTFAYDNIMEALSKEDKSNNTNNESDNANEKPSQSHNDLRYRFTSNDSTATPADGNLSTATNDSTAKSDNSSVPPEVDIQKLQTRLSRLLRFYPLSIAIKKGVMVLGNNSTPSLLINSCKTATGIIDIKAAASECDIYKQFFFFNFDTFQTSIRPNILYNRAYEDHSKSNMQFNNSSSNLKKKHSLSLFERFQNSLNVFSKLSKKLKLTPSKTKEDFESYRKWTGLRRYIDSGEDQHNFFEGLATDEEYAKYSLILDTVSTKFSYYYDIPGPVRASELNSHPQYGADIEFSMATIHYGAWADKQRVPIQNMFFPPFARDSEPSKKPTPGQLREYDGFKVNILTNDEIIFRVPTREPSKDKLNLKTHNPNQNQQSSNSKSTRPFGWIELKLAPNSSISSFTSFLSSKERGWPNGLSAVFMQPELRSSVNHDILYMADIHTIEADIGFPLKWNGECEWRFNNFSSNGKIFFLREHTLLFSDIFTDFASGPATPYEQFRPFKYFIDWDLENYKLYLNVNDSNIINNPLDFNSNKYLSFQGESLKIKSMVPLLGQFTKFTSVEFEIFAPYFDLTLDLPPWHTSSAFIDNSYVIGRASEFTINGSYSYYSDIEVNSANHIVLRCKGDDVTLKMYGSLVKYVFVVRENYLGDNFHFKTFEEYNNDLLNNSPKDTTYNTQNNSSTSVNNNSVDSDETLREEHDYWGMIKTDNDVDVLFSFAARNALLVLPHDVYGCKSHIGLSFDYFDADIRFTNYYMDMQADFSEVRGKYVHLEGDNEDTMLLDIPNYVKTFKVREDPHITLDELSVHGHRMFGIPPTEITYYCNWRVATNSIEVNSPPQFLGYLGQSIGVFVMGFKDLQNALHSSIPIVYDALSFTFDCPSLQIRLNCDSGKSHIIKMEPLLVNMNDFNNIRYTSKLSVSIPVLEVMIIDRTSDQLISMFKTSLNLDNITRKPKFQETRKFQQEHIRFNDAPFHRVPYLLFNETKDTNYNEAYCSMLVTISLPDGHYPINRYTKRIFDAKNSSDASLLSTLSGSDASLADSVNIESGNLFVSPTIHYEEGDFAPESQNDHRFKYDNMILTFSDVVGYTTPESLHAIAQFEEELIQTDFRMLMDVFERKTVKNLAAQMLQICMHDTFRIVAPSVNISIGNFSGTNQEELLKSAENVPVINVLIDEPSLALSESTLRTKLDNGEFFMETKSSSAFSIKNISLNISSPKDFALPINLNIKDVEFWSNEDDKTDIFSVSIEDVLFNLNESQFTWLISYFEQMMEQIDTALKTFESNKHRKDKLEASFIYRLGVASKDLKIDHDSEVLTKPAYLIRSLKEHIRFYDSWMVLIRLRHIFETAGSDWSSREEARLRERTWKLPDSAYDETWETFSKWRSWEANLQEREQFFEDIFGIKQLTEKTATAQILLKHAAISWSGENNMESDYFDFQDINASFSDKRSDAMFSQLNDEFLKDFNARVKNFGLVVNLGAYRGHISPITLNVLPSLTRDLQRVIPKKDSDTKGDDNCKVNNSATFFMINVNEFQQRLTLDSLGFEIHFNELSTSGVSQIIESDELLSFSASIPILGLVLHAGNKEIMTSGVEELKLVYGNGKAPNLTYLFNLSIDNSFMELSGDEISKTLDEVIETDMKYLDLIKSTLGDGKTKPSESKTSESEDPFAPLIKALDTIQANVNLQLNHFSFMIKIAKYISIDGALYDNNWSLALTDGVADIGSLLQKSDLSIKLKDSEVLKSENSQMFTNIKVGQSNGIPMFKVDTQFGFSKVMVPKFVKSINEFLACYPEIREEVDHLSTTIRKLSDTSEKSISEVDKKSGDNKKIDIFAIPIDFKFANDYIGLSFIADRTKYSLETEDIELILNNVSKQGKSFTSPYSGTFKVPTARLSIVDRIIPMGLSNFVDINVSSKVVIGERNEKVELLEISSQFCRICLSLGVIQRIVYLVDELTIISKKITKVFGLDLKKDPLEPKPKERNSEGKLPIFCEITSIHFLSYNFCIGWIFEDRRPNYPGLILGAERFYAVTDENIGKLSLIEAYLSVAHGASSASFFSSQSEKASSNRAFLPFMQFIYIINEAVDSKDMKITITGDELDVDYLSDAFHILESGIKSASRIQTYFNERVRPMDKWKDESKTHEEQQVDYLNSLRSTFSSIECKATFAGSNVLLHRLGDNGSIEEDKNSSLFLHFPAVKSITTYVHDKVGPKKHIIKSEMLTSSSDNKLYAACVPVIMDILEEVKGMMKPMKPTDLKNKPPESQEESKQTQKHVDYSSVLNEVDFHLGLRIDKQRLSFSCEPTAKVEAVVGIEGICFQVNSGLNSSVNGVAVLDTISASLQHVYSREVSGSIGINTVSLSTNVELDKEINIRTVASISNFDGYVNVKQYQDLDLFKDIWYPKTSELSNFDENEPCSEEPPVLASNKSIASRVAEVSNSNALPWFVTFLLSNVSIRVNFGPSLGVMRLGLDQFWMVSKRAVDWSQQLKLGVDRLELSSEGRLGGTVIVKDIYLHSAITWKCVDSSTLDVPLVLLSLGIESLKLKSTFDYHMFAVANIENFSIDLFNRKSEHMISKDRLFAAARFKTFELYMTSFTASNVFDIYNAVLRMTQENKISYTETLHDSNKEKKVNDLVQKPYGNAILETVKKLETEFEVIAGTFLIHVYPSSFDDSKVLVIKLDESSAQFQQNEYNDGISNQLDIQFNDLSVSLSVNTPISENFIHESTVDEFSKYARKARGGNIFLFPSFQISMKTFQKYNSNLIEYLYKTTFGGTVDIRWNLGSVNFIREMYSIHSKSLASRTEFRKTLKNRDDEIDFKENMFDTKQDHKPEHTNTLIDTDPQKTSTEKIDLAINEKIDKVSKDSKYSYLPLAPPVIEVPQLKELGNATPPLEWFGLHRNKFPNVTHELGIVNLQKIIHEVELEYSKILGKA